MHMRVLSLFIAGVLVALLALVSPVSADTIELKDGHPDRYVVQKGDTLWDISKRFLEDPWRWASVWTINEQVRNPHLIYPGDVIVLTWKDGKPQLGVQREEVATAPAEQAPTPAGETPAEQVAEPAPPTKSAPLGPAPSGLRTVKLQPRVHEESIKDAIPTIDPAAIAPFLTSTIAVSRSELEDAGYVTVGLDNRLALGDGSEFYARHLPRKGKAENFLVFRPGRPLTHPDTGVVLAYEAIFLGEARLLKPGDPAKLLMTRVNQEILPTDRLLEAPERPGLPYYMPRVPTKQVEGRILGSQNGMREYGPNAVVAISLGKRDGMEEGHVLRILRHVGQRKDPVSGREYKIPDENSGLLMVFRVFDKVSYGIITDVNRPIQIYDALRNP